MNDDLTPEERWLADALAEISRRRGPGRGFTPRPTGHGRRVSSLVLVAVLSAALVSAAILLPRFVFPIAHGHSNASQQSSGPCTTTGLVAAESHSQGGVAKLTAAYASSASAVAQWQESRLPNQMGTASSAITSLAGNTPIAVCYYSGSFIGFPEPPPVPGSTPVPEPYYRYLILDVAGTRVIVDTVSRSAPPFGPPPIATLAPASALCEQGVAVTHLTVRRTNEFPQNHIRFDFPADVTVASSSQARMVADAVCALPRMPSGTLSCPADLGIVYHLSFWAGGVEFRAVSVGATGCQVVRGLGVQRWVARSPDFWRTLGVAMGLTRPDLAAFQGPPP